MTDVLQQLLVVFDNERREHTDDLRAILQRMAEGRAGEAELHDAMRRAHSLKGAARIVGLSYIETLAHEMEAVFQNKTTLSKEMRRCIEEMLDNIEDWIALPEGERAEAPSAALLKKVRDAVAISGADSGQGETEAPRPEAGVNSPQSGVASLDISSPPANDEFPDQTRPERVQDRESHAIGRCDEIRVSADSIDNLLLAATDLHSDLAGLEAAQKMLGTVRSKLAQSCASRQQRPAMPKLIGHSFVGSRAAQRRPDVEDEREQALSEALNVIAAAVEQQNNSVRLLRRHLNDLNHSVKSVRMTPASTIFGGFRKMARDVATFEGKEIDIDIVGLESAADRRVLQRMKDPVMHVLRNAISHGIEPSNARQSLGKPTKGRVSLKITRSGDSLRFMIEDDGNGLDTENIRSCALENCIISEEQASRFDDGQIHQLIFVPGFSTAQDVSAISGRGVGLSAVRETVNELQGDIRIETQVGAGTRIILSVPIGFVVQSMLLVDWKGQRFALPSRTAIRLERIQRDQIRTSCGEPILPRNDGNIKLFSLGSLFGQPQIEIGDDGGFAIILCIDGQRHGIVVDRLAAVEECVVQPADFLRADREKWSGIVTGADGKASLVINIDGIRMLGQRGESASIKPLVEPKRAKCILVVDDSITTRTLEKSILEAHGYHVRLSVNGQDALEQLRKEPCDLVVSDVEMPHMNGFELLAAIRRDPSLAKTPLILVTSLDKPEHKERGMTLGADAYVVKQRFDQSELLNIVQQLA